MSFCLQHVASTVTVEGGRKGKEGSSASSSHWPRRAHITPTPIGGNESHGHIGAKGAGKCSSWLSSPFPAIVLHSGRKA